MLIIFGVLVILASVVLGLIVLVQNPKGGGLSSSFGGIGNQLMGVKQTTDILEKGTWLFAGVVGLLCLLSPIFIPKSATDVKNEQLIKDAPVSPGKSQTTAPLPSTGSKPVDSGSGQ
jgi:preprotein translocase subunit SecG